MSADTHMPTAIISTYELILESRDGTLTSIPCVSATAAVELWLAQRELFHMRSATLVASRKEVPWRET